MWVWNRSLRTLLKPCFSISSRAFYALTSGMYLFDKVIVSVTSQDFLEDKKGIILILCLVWLAVSVSVERWIHCPSHVGWPPGLVSSPIPSIHWIYILPQYLRRRLVPFFLFPSFIPTLRRLDASRHLYYRQKDDMGQLGRSIQDEGVSGSGEWPSWSTTRLKLSSRLWLTKHI